MSDYAKAPPDYSTLNMPAASPSQGVGYPTLPSAPPDTTTTVVHHQTIVVSRVPSFSDRPQLAFCSNCQQQVTTTCSYDSGNGTWLMAFLLFIFGIWCCCCLPFCMDGSKNCSHFCPICQSRIGEKKFLF